MRDDERNNGERGRAASMCRAYDAAISRGGGALVAERKRKVDVPGLGKRDAVEVGFRSSAEHWNEYLADDGSVIRVKLVMSDLVRIVDEWDPEGNPAYLIKSQQILNVSAPENLRRQ